MNERYDRKPEGDVPTVKMTIRLEPEVAMILRGIAADWGRLPLHEAVALCAKWFIASGGHRQSRIVFEGESLAQIEAAVARWRRRQERAGKDASAGEGAGGVPR